MGREKPPFLLKDEYNKIIDNNLAADNLCKFFYSTYTQYDGKMPHIIKSYEDMEDDIIFSCDDIKSLLHKLPSKSSSGPDSIYSIYYKKSYLKNYVSPYLYYFNILLIKKLFPMNGGWLM